MDECEPNYGGQIGSQLAEYQNKAGMVRKPNYNPTIRENLDNRIAEHQKCIEELEAIKAKVPDALIDMKIADLLEAMRF